MVAWTNEIVKQNDEYTYVEFTNGRHKFVKKYKGNVDLTDKLNYVNNKKDVFTSLKGLINKEFDISDGWKYVITYAHMPSDFVEVFTEIYSPWQTFNKRFNVTTVNSTGELNSYILGQKTILNKMIKDEDKEGLESYLGGEVTLDGNDY